VTYSGATTANVLTDSQNGAPRQMESLDGSEDLVKVTIGGNDVGYVPLLMAAGHAFPVRAGARRMAVGHEPRGRHRVLTEESNLRCH
jgi:hypothetical protein